jgi:hypothetical protein
VVRRRRNNVDAQRAARRLRRGTGCGIDVRMGAPIAAVDARPDLLLQHAAALRGREP